MDKLFEISREEGFPFCAETMQVLYDNARAVNVLLAGLNLPNNSAVLLGVEDPSGALNDPLYSYRYLYAVSNYKKRLVRYTRGNGVSMRNLSSAKVTITETIENVHNTNGDVIERVYATERAVIENTNVETEKWKFYRLKDVLEPAIYTDLLPEFRTQISNTPISLDESYDNILCKNEKKLRVKLKITSQPVYALEQSNVEVRVPIPGITGVYQLNAMLFFNSRYYRVEAILNNGILTLYTGQTYTNNGIEPNLTHHVQTAQIILINSEVLL